MGLFLTAAAAKDPRYAHVNSNADNESPPAGVYTLRAAIAAMSDPAFVNTNGQRVITIDPSVGVIELGKKLEVKADAAPFTIRGAATGPGIVTIAPSRSLRVGESEALLLISNEGLTLENLTFQGNKLPEYRETGVRAIYMNPKTYVYTRPDCFLTISNCAFLACGASDSLSQTRRGGAIYVDPSNDNREFRLTFDHCSFTGCYADYRHMVASGQGGAVWCAGARRWATFRDCSFESNTAAYGGMYSDRENTLGGAVYCNKASVFERCTFHGNEAYYDATVSFDAAFPGDSSFTDCLLSANRDEGQSDYMRRIAPYLRDLRGDVVWPVVQTQEVSGALHAFVYPWRGDIVTNASPESATIPDLLGAKPIGPTLGAVRSVCAVRITLDPGVNGWFSKEDEDKTSFWGVAGQPFSDFTLPVPVRENAEFLGWWSGPGRTGEQYFDSEGKSITDARVPGANDVTLYAGWKITDSRLVVSEGAESSIQDKFVRTLRGVVKWITDQSQWGGLEAGDEICVTFYADSLDRIWLNKPLEVPSGTLPFTICGKTDDGKVIPLVPTSPMDALIVLNSSGLTLQALTLAAAGEVEGGTAAVGTAVVANAGALTLENCRISCAKQVVAALGDSLLMRDCSIVGAPGSAPSLLAAATNTVVNCSFLGKGGGGGAVCARETLVVKSTFAGCAAPALTVDAGFGGSLTQVDTLVDEGLGFRDDSSPAADGSGVLHDWRAAFYGPVATNGAVFVWADETWANVATSASADASAPRTAVRGAADRATRLLDKDELGAAEIVPARGAIRSQFAVRYDFLAPGCSPPQSSLSFLCGRQVTDRAPIPVRPRYVLKGWKTAGGELLFGDQGQPIGTWNAPFRESVELFVAWRPTEAVLKDVGDETMLKEALDALADPENKFPDRTVTIGRPFYLTQTMDIPSSTAAFAIAGRGNMIQAGDVLFFRHDGRGLALSDLAFRGGAGVIRATGPVSALNCAFRESGQTDQTDGGALYLGGTSNRFVNCTFAMNRGRDGGAVALAGDGAVFVHCTFTGNAAGRGGAVHVSGGTHHALACTFAGNFATNGLCACVAGGRMDFTSCALASDPEQEGTDVAVSGGGFSEMTLTSVSHGADAVPPEQILRNWASRQTENVNGVEHMYHPPAVNVTMKSGVWIWHDGHWGSIAYGTTYTGGTAARTAVVGSAAACTVAKQTDQIDWPIFETFANRGAVLMVSQEGLGLQVTTGADDIDPTDGRTSFREALALAMLRIYDPGPDGLQTITFGDSLFDANGRATVRLDIDSRRLPDRTITTDLAVRGPTDGREVTLAISNTLGVPALMTSNGVSLVLSNLTVGYQPGDAAGGENSLLSTWGDLVITDCAFANCRQIGTQPMIVAHDGLARVERCSFVGSGRTDVIDGGALKTWGARLSVIDCTFANLNLAVASGGAFAPVESMNGSTPTSLHVINCTFFGNRAIRSAGVWSDGFADVCAVNCVFNGGRTRDGAANDFRSDAANGVSALCGSVYSATSGQSVKVVDCLREGNAGRIFNGGLRTITVGGVPRAYLFPKANGAADRTGLYTWHDSAWTNVAVSALYVARGDPLVITGKRPPAEFLLAGRYDVTGRDVLDGIGTKLGSRSDRRPSRGSYATPGDGEDGVRGELTVNVAEDDATDTPDRYDRRMSLREAVAFANTHPDWRDANGNCRVTFADSIFGTHQTTIASAYRQIEVTGVTNGTLTVVGPDVSDRMLTLDGAGSHRIFHVAAGNALELVNLNFTNAVSELSGRCTTYAGGAVNNQGTLRVRNCAFRGCRALGGVDAASGRAFGGAICTESGGEAEVEQCTFAGCAARNGGAVCVTEDAVTTLATSVFTRNAAISGGIRGLGRGGAVCTLDGAGRTALVNCTVSGNAADATGGGVHAGRTDDAADGAAISLHLLDSIVLGNAATEGPSDLYLDGGRAKSAHCWFGRRNAGASDDLWTDLAAVRTDAVPADIFAVLTPDAAGLTYDLRPSSVVHTCFAINAAVETGAAYVWTADGWANVGYAPTQDGRANLTVLYSASAAGQQKLRRAGVPMVRDQLGDSGIAVRALMGATALYQPSDIPLPSGDPLVVSGGDFAAFLKAYNYAATHTGDARLVSNDCITITFTGGGTLSVASNLTLTAFASPRLRIRGPVTFDGGGRFRPFTLGAGNGLVLEDVTFVNCLGEDGFGGAVQLDGAGAELTARRVAFEDCAAQEVGGISSGGAVSVIGKGSAARFEDCAFRNCRATAGTCVDRFGCDAVTFFGCTFAPETDERLATEVSPRLNALVIRAVPWGRKDWYCTVAAALPECAHGDTLVLLNPNGPDEELVRQSLPSGVSLRVYPDPSGRALVNDLAAVGTEPWYTATVRETADGMCTLEVVPNELAAPGVGEGAVVDFEAEGGTRVSVRPTNVKPGMSYGLGRSETPDGRYVVADDGWVRADERGVLPRALTAPKGGSTGYYRVFAR